MPPVDLAAERKHGEFVRKLIDERKLSACHDVSDGGLLVAIAEMALAGKTGVTLSVSGNAGFWFGEDQARYILATSKPDDVLAAAKTAGLPMQVIGKAEGEALKLGDASVVIKTLRDLHESWLPQYMSA